MNEREQSVRPVRWRKTNPEVYVELRRTWGVIGHSSVLMVLSLSLIGTWLTLGYLHLPGWLETSARMGTSGAAVGCGGVGLCRLVWALFRSVRAVVRTRQRGAEGEAQGEKVEESAPEATLAAGPS